MTDPTQPAGSGTAKAYILLDRTGSMSSLWDEALSSVNAFATDLAKPGAPIAQITLAVFDAQDGLQFDVLRRNVLASNWTAVTSAEATPRGMTPLFDALGRLIALAEGDGADKAMIVVMTDGEENSSREVTKEGAKAALERVAKRGWQTVFLGADFAKFADAENIGVAGGQSMGMRKDRMMASMQRLASKTQAYYETSAPVAFNQQDREESGEADLQNKAGPGAKK